MSGFNAPVLLTVEDGGASFAVAEERVYTGSNTPPDSWTIPAGFRTDFATIPAAVSWAIPKLGAYTLAAIVHDLLCEGLNDWHHWKKKCAKAHWGAPPIPHRIPDFPTANAVDTDAIFRKIARDYGTDPVTAALLWVGVRWGALSNPARREGWFRRDVVWRVLGLSLLFAPVLVPATVLAVGGRLVLRLVRRIFR